MKRRKTFFSPKKLKSQKKKKLSRKKISRTLVLLSGIVLKSGF